jgi:PAS domain S-box-containing protein
MLQKAHRLARTNYPIRAASFAYVFVIVTALVLERRLALSSLAYPLIALLVYPHLAFLHARWRGDRRAEIHSLVFDGAVLGVLMAQFGLPLWLSCALILGVCVNNAVCAGAKNLAYAVIAFTLGALLANFAGRFGVTPDTGALVTGLSALGMVGYASAVGLVMHRQNRYLVLTRIELRKSEQLFRVIAEHAGDLVAVVDPQGQLIYLSAASQKRFSSPPLDVSDWSPLVHAPERDRAKRFVESLLRTSTRARAAFHLIGADGSLVVMECEGTPVLDANGRLSLLVLVGHEYTPATETPA